MKYTARKSHCEALMELKPGAEWKLSGSEYSGLEWLDKVQTKPTKAEFDAKKAEKADIISKL